MALKANKIYSGSIKLGEGPLWNEEHRCLHFVDIEGRKIITVDSGGEFLRSYSLPKMPGCILLESADRLIVSAEDTVYRLHLDTEEWHELSRLPMDSSLRFNDGKCDPNGRLVVGTMVKVQGEHAKGKGSLYTFDGKAWRILKEQLTIPNGLAWWGESTFYHTDTTERTVRRYQYDLASGTLGESEICISIQEDEGDPDGLCIDEEGMLWVAQWNGYQVGRYNPNTGEKLLEIGVDAANVSCCVFGGENRSTLYITTAQNEKGEGGDLFSYETATRGIPPYQYRPINVGE